MFVIPFVYWSHALRKKIVNVAFLKKIINVAFLNPKASHVMVDILVFLF